MKININNIITPHLNKLFNEEHLNKSNIGEVLYNIRKLDEFGTAYWLYITIPIMKCGLYIHRSPTIQKKGIWAIHSWTNIFHTFNINLLIKLLAQHHLIIPFSNNDYINGNYINWSEWKL